MKSNNEHFTDKNFIKLNSPINRISNVSYFFMNDLFTNLMPSIIFILVVFAFFTYSDPKMGGVFILANLFLFLYIIFVMPTIIKKNKDIDAKQTNSDLSELY
jgi:ABC-type bacteriocin/lantibiotic exporter with double-glycine peptidase domain